MTSISIKAAFGKALTAKVLRAGLCSLKKVS